MYHLKKKYKNPLKRWEWRDVKIAKVINNNVISVLNEQGQELVVMGRGIAFQKAWRSGG